MSEQNSFAKIRKEFIEKLDTKILPKVRQFENERKQKLCLAKIISSFFIILGIVILFYIKDSPRLALFLISSSFVIWYSFKKNFEIKIKDKIMPIICSLFSDLNWQNGEYEDIYEFMPASIVPKYHEGEPDDVFIGKWEDIPFNIIESKFYAKSGKNRYTVFSGVIIKIKMNKNFNGHTVIKPDCLLHITPETSLHHTTLEDVKFEKKYDVFTNDDIEARYLITPLFMERLNNIKTAFNSNNISCSFYKKHIYIGLETTQDLFTLCSLTKPLDNREQYFIFLEEILSVIRLIKYFNLDSKTKL